MKTIQKQILNSRSGKTFDLIFDVLGHVMLSEEGKLHVVVVQSVNRIYHLLKLFVDAADQIDLPYAVNKPEKTISFKGRGRIKFVITPKNPIDEMNFLRGYDCQIFKDQS